MDRTLARYPFLDAARTAVTESESSLEDILGGSGRSAAVDRALERVEQALSSDTIGPPRSDDEVELLSYPLARIIVSLVDDARVTTRYVQAEANTATDRLGEDRSRHGATDGELAYEWWFEEFDIDVHRGDGAWTVAVLDYLRLTDELDGDRWRLVNRELDRGRVPLDTEELPQLLEAVIRRRISRDLPLVVPDEVATRLGDAVGEIKSAIGSVRLPAEIPVVDPDAFPPCMQALVTRVESGDTLAMHARYSLAAFLTSLGLAPEELNRVIEEPVPETLTEMAKAVVGEDGPTQFPPGSCETLIAYDVCVNPDQLCEQIDHPLEYYSERLETV